MSDNLSRLLDLANALQAEAPHGMNSSRASTCRYAAEELRDKRTRLAEAERVIAAAAEFWTTYSSLSERYQDDMNDERHAMLERMRAAVSATGVPNGEG